MRANSLHIFAVSLKMELNCLRRRIYAYMYANKVTDVKSFMCNFDNRIKTLSACERERARRKRKEKLQNQQATITIPIHTHSTYVQSTSWLLYGHKMKNEERNEAIERKLVERTLVKINQNAYACACECVCEFMCAKCVHECVIVCRYVYGCPQKEVAMK